MRLLSNVFGALTLAGLAVPIPMMSQFFTDLTSDKATLSMGGILDYMTTATRALFANATIATVTTELVLLVVAFVVFMMYETHMRGMRGGRLYIIFSYYVALGAALPLFCARRLSCETKSDGHRLPPRRFGFGSSFIYTILSIICVVSMSTLSSLKSRPHLFAIPTALFFIVLPWAYMLTHRSQPLKNSDHTSENRSKARTLVGVLCGASTVLAVVTRLRLALYLTAPSTAKLSWATVITQFIDVFRQSGLVMTVGLDALIVFVTLAVLIGSDENLPLGRRLLVLATFFVLPGLGFPLYVMMITGSSALRSFKTL